MIQPQWHASYTTPDIYYEFKPRPNICIENHGWHDVIASSDDILTSWYILLLLTFNMGMATPNFSRWLIADIIELILLQTLLS